MGGYLVHQKMKHSERVAQAVVEALEPGARMRYQTRQSHGEHDFDLVYPDRRVATLEVTGATDEHGERTSAALLDRRKGGQFIPTKLCRHDWYIHPDTSASINKIRNHADEYLAEVEAEGLVEFFSPLNAWDQSSVRRIWIDLHVLGGSIWKWKTPGQIGISVPGGGGARDMLDFINAVRAVAAKDDILRKLGAANTEERHQGLAEHVPRLAAARTQRRVRIASRPRQDSFVLRCGDQLVTCGRMVQRDTDAPRRIRHCHREGLRSERLPSPASSMEGR